MIQEKGRAKHIQYFLYGSSLAILVTVGLPVCPVFVAKEHKRNPAKGSSFFIELSRFADSAGFDALCADATGHLAAGFVDMNGL